MTLIPFTKMHGAGNDYIYVNTMLHEIPDPALASIEWSRPHFAIGSDGLILIGHPTVPDADFSMRIFNADGSEAMMCGNGTRCVAKYLYDKRLTRKNPIRLETRSGIKILQLHLSPSDTVDSVTVDMGQPHDIQPLTLTLPAVPASDSSLPPSFSGFSVSTGNPHFVIFLDQNPETFPIDLYGPMLSTHPHFPDGCNIEFAQVRPDGTIRMRVWERGSGITLACGTGACATAVAAHHAHLTPSSVHVQMDGGTLHINWDPHTRHIFMTGPAAISFEGTIPLP